MFARVYIRPKVFLLLLKRKGWSRKDFAKHSGFDEWTVRMWVSGRMCPREESTVRIMKTFSGCSHKPGGRVTWDDLFQTVVVETEASA